ncbi:MAG: LPXTG cell wall anchor domain-containing protein [Streptomyces sp.]|nr:LPXTG cell wall anchor domain-containing protein [Streptomyces sp.]
MTTKVSGLPGKIAAGSGWHPFSMSVSNASGNDYKRVDFALFAATESAKNWNEDTSHLTLQFQNPDTGKWVDISLDENDPDAGYLGWTSVKAHESFTLKLRLDIDAKADAGKGYVLGFGVYADSKGECVLSGGDDNSYLFEVLAAGSTGGGSAQPDSGGQKPLPAKPAGDLQLTGGDLAETGSSSMLPTIAIVGGVAVALGAGGMFVLRRRKAGTPGGLAS